MPCKGPDHFAGTFRAKADTMKLWPLVEGWVEGDKICAAICIRITKRAPLVANLQLLHTFSTERRRGLATKLVLRGYWMAAQTADYFRVSSEPDAQEFYRSLGLKFWGTQKSGSLLCVHRIKGNEPDTGNYAMTPAIQKMLFSGRRGALVEKFDTPR